ncbi:MAG: hypothetical protein R3F19_30780 [Verrucomicrobiales bacterium]
MSEASSQILPALNGFASWLDGNGELSWDHQSYFGGPIGSRAKALYYRHKLLGTAAVAPMIFSEAFVPSARRLFHKPMRFPIADAHYAMGFSFLHQTTGDQKYFERSSHFLDVLAQTRCKGLEEYGWGYPFDWVTRNGTLFEHTPLITTLPYVYEAFLQAYRIDPRPQWKLILESIIRHASNDYRDEPTSDTASSCTYTPTEGTGVINSSAYRSFLLTSAAKEFPEGNHDADRCWQIAQRNLNFVLENQNADGSWYYATDGVRDFVDHFHTCFVMKGLAKVHALTGHAACLEALRKGVDYYLDHLFDPEDGLPKPFSRAPRLTVYTRELYDCAESINLCLLLRDRFSAMGEKLGTVVNGILEDWIQPSGCFRARQLKFGWDNVPMHRWGQAQMFRSLAFFHAEDCS